MSESTLCSCWTDKNKGLQAKGFEISDVCSALVLGVDKVTVQHYLPVQRLDGKRLKRSDPHGITISFCPFCGKSLKPELEGAGGVAREA